MGKMQILLRYYCQNLTSIESWNLRIASIELAQSDRIEKPIKKKQIKKDVTLNQSHRTMLKMNLGITLPRQKKKRF